MPDNPTAGGTSLPIDPNTGFKIIGGTSTSWGYQPAGGGGGWGPLMCLDYRYSGGPKRLRDLGTDMGWNITDVKNTLRQCSRQIAGAATIVSSVITQAWASYGPALQAAIGASSWGSLTIFEARGVVLTSLTAADLLILAAAAGVSVLALWALYTCVSDLP